MDIIDISKEEKINLLKELNNAFDDGFDFEKFLKPFLETYGLKEIAVKKIWRWRN